MYSLRVEARARRTAQLKIDDSGEAHENFMDDGWEGELPLEDCEIAFTAGNPRVEHLTGVVHLYRPTPVPAERPTGFPSAQQHQQQQQQQQRQLQQEQTSTSSLPPGGVWSQEHSSGSSCRRRSTLPEDRGLRLCCLAIPADMSVAHFCTFCGAYLTHIREMRVLRRESSTRVVCMVLITFTNQEHADTFYQDFNLSPFSSLEPEIVCRLVFVRDVDVTAAQPGRLPERPDPPPLGTTELPSCPVCLERLDEHISGVVTTVCNHRFHSACLQQWGDTSCPVCRYCTQPGGAHSSRCAACSASADLWICLICGHVGCGRYREGHARHHFTDSQHCYALELETQRVWDYVGDNYVHRLIQSKTDGKLVEVPAPTLTSAPRRRGRHGSGTSGAASTRARCAAAGRRPSSGGDNGDSDSDRGEEGEDADGQGNNDLKEALMASKLDAIAAEYNHLLATQLDSQRQYYDNLLGQAMAEADQRVAMVTSNAMHAEERSDAALAHSREAERRRQAAERKLSDATANLKKVQEERELLRSLNEALIHNQKELQKAVATAREQLTAKDAAVTDLQEQVRDLMMFIEGQRAIDSSGDADMQGATLLPCPASAAPPKERRSGKGKGRS